MTTAWRPQVYLVGAGPGDPGLLTRRGEALLKRADVVFFDALIHPGVLALIPEKTVRVAVGKRAGGVGPKQQSINEQMVEAAREGRRVVRLKGGDPFVFGRGGEEITALADAGIRFEVVPGVTSASSVPAMIGVPLTVRGLSSVIHIVTGHEDPADLEGPVDWDLFTRSGHTVVVLMGSAHLIQILQRLRSAGMDPATPLAVIHWGTLARQRAVRGVIGEALANPDRFAFASPALAVIGAVAGMDERLNWFERRPLFGRRILLTRPEAQGSAMLDALSEAGADVENIPLTRLDMDAHDDDARLLQSLHRLRSNHGWIVLPSSPAIRSFFGALERLGADARDLAGIRLAVLSRKGAAELGLRGIRADFISGRPEGATLGKTLPFEGEGTLVLVAGSANSREELRSAIEARGGECELHALYETRPDREGIRQVHARLSEADEIEVVLFAPSALHALIDATPPEDRGLLEGVKWWAIGPTTAAAIEKAGLRCMGHAATPTPDALIEMFLGHESRGSGSATRSALVFPAHNPQP